MRKVQLYIEGDRIELFNDEQIQVTSSIQNVQDISKTYTDFSQGFTVPASDVNNAFFQHWYNSDIDFTTDNNLRKDGYLELNLTTFRKGKVQLDGAVIKEGNPESYKLTFYGEGITLKDTFGEDLISDLDFTDLAYDYTSAEILDRIIDNTNAYDVKYPLITSNRLWEYQAIPLPAALPNWLTAVLTSNDIHTTSGAINKDELFPAVRVRSIFKAIEVKYGISFQGAFLDDERFTKLFLWFKAKESLITTSYAHQLSVSSITPTFTNYDLSGYVDGLTNTITIEELAGVLTHRIDFEVLSTTSSDDYYIDILQNGNLLSTIVGSGTGVYSIANITQTAGLNTTYSIQIRTSGSNVITSETRYNVDYITSGSIQTDYVTIAHDPLTLNLQVNLSANAPIMKIGEFVKGIMLMFNMTIYSVKDNEYWIEPLDDWYSKGAVVDISEYTDVNTIEHTRMPLYKKISFKFQDSECFLNKQFSQTYNRNYGDTTYQYNYDGGEFIVEVPFENLLQTKYNGTQMLQVGYALNNEFAPYIPKPVLLYQYDNETCDFKFANDGGGHTTVTTYTPFGQDLKYNSQDWTLNFSPETSTILEYPIQNTMFASYYFSYLYNLYNLKQRLINVKTKLPISLITGLQLNDRLIIRDRRYIINEMKSNLTTGEVDFQLILDFRPIVNSTNPNPKVLTEGGCIEYTINLPNGAINAELSCSNPDVTFSPNPIEHSTMVSICLPSGDNTVYTIVVIYTYANGSQSQETFYIYQ
jgi:hypothetical protein